MIWGLVLIIILSFTIVFVLESKFHADASFDYHKYETQIKYAETLSHYTTQIYIGGKAPTTGKIMEWEE